MNGNLFTPRMGVTSNERYKLQISDEDQVKIMRGRTWEAIVTDIETGVHYRARGAECSASPECFCDAIAGTSSGLYWKSGCNITTTSAPSRSASR